MRLLSILTLALAPAFSLASPIRCDLDPRNVNPEPRIILPVPSPRAMVEAVTVFSVSMAADSACTPSKKMIFAAYNTSSTGCLATRGPSFGSMEIMLASDNPISSSCTAHIYETAECQREVGRAEAVGAGEGVCIYPGLGQQASGWSVVCTRGFEFAMQ